MQPLMTCLDSARGGVGASADAAGPSHVRTADTISSTFLSVESPRQLVRDIAFMSWLRAQGGDGRSSGRRDLGGCRRPCPGVDTCRDAHFAFSTSSTQYGLLTRCLTTAVPGHDSSLQQRGGTSSERVAKPWPATVMRVLTSCTLATPCQAAC